MNNIFILIFPAEIMCVEEGRVLVDVNSKRAIDCKPKHDFNVFRYSFSEAIPVLFNRFKSDFLLA